MADGVAAGSAANPPAAEELSPRPLDAAVAIAVEEPAPRPRPRPACPGTGDHPAAILVVDDEPVIRQVLVNQLATEGYQVSQASSGPQALASLEKESRPEGAQTQYVDLVLLDVMMPRMSGYEVCRRLRRRHALDDLPVIFLTARNRVEDLVVGLAAGGLSVPARAQSRTPATPYQRALG